MRKQAQREKQRNSMQRTVICIRSGFSATGDGGVPAAIRRLHRAEQRALAQMIPRERRAVYALTHLMLPWVYQMASHPRVLDAVEGRDWAEHPGMGIGLVCEVSARRCVYLLAPGRRVLGIATPKVTTAWIALSPSTLESGCMQVMPGTQKMQLPQRETYALDNALSRGQEIALEVDESKAVAMCLAPGKCRCITSGLRMAPSQTAQIMRGSGSRSAISLPRWYSRAASGKLCNWCGATMSMATLKLLRRRTMQPAPRRSARKRSTGSGECLSQGR